MERARAQDGFAAPTGMSAPGGRRRYCDRLRCHAARHWRCALAVLLAVLWAAPAWADLRCRAEVDRSTVATGERIVLTVHAEGRLLQAPRHEPPRIEGVQVVAGGTSQSYSMDSAGTYMTAASEYFLIVQRHDSFQIPSVQLTAGNERCATNVIKITVVSGSPPQEPTGGTVAPDPAAGAPTSPPPRPQPSVPAVPESRPGSQAGQPPDPEFITLDVDRDKVWIGQQMILTFRYYRQRNSWERPSYSPPRTEGFWRLDLPPERSYRRTVGGVVYEVTEIRYALFPTRTGTLTIESAALSLASDPFERMFGRRSRGPRQLRTDPLSIEVRELPAPRPPEFSGIVASQLQLTAALSAESAARGEPLALTLVITADGFLKSYRGLNLPDPAGARLYEASTDLQEDVSGPRYVAVLREEKVVVPVQEGRFVLPPLELNYFDPAVGDYRTARAQVPEIAVLPSDLPVAGDDPSGFRRAEIARLGRDLAFIHTAAGSLRRATAPPLANWLWWTVLLLPWILLGLYRWRLNRLIAAERDPVGQRRRLAWPRARRVLQRLERGGGDVGELVQTVQRFIADRSGRAAAGLTAADVRAWCAEQGRAPTGERLAAIMSACDEVRFGGGGAVDLPARAAEVKALLAAWPHRKTGESARRGGPQLSLLAGLALIGLVAADPAAAIGPSPVAAPAPGGDPSRLLAEANQAYVDGDLDLAQQRYEELLRRGNDAAVVHYNLGNTLARRGELGRAIASYLRAQRLAPRDQDIRANLAWVRSHTRDLELAGQGLPPVVAQLDAMAHRLALDEWAWLLVALSGLTVVAVAWTWRQGWLSPAWRRCRLLLAALTLLAAAVTATRWFEEDRRDIAVVVSDEVTVRSGPASSFPEVFRIHDGLTLDIRGERDGWARIGLGGDWVGWVPTDVLERVR